MEKIQITPGCLMVAPYMTRKLCYRKDDRAMRPTYGSALKIFGTP